MIAGAAALDIGTGPIVPLGSDKNMRPDPVHRLEIIGSLQPVGIALIFRKRRLITVAPKQRKLGDQTFVRN